VRWRVVLFSMDVTFQFQSVIFSFFLMKLRCQVFLSCQGTTHKNQGILKFCLDFGFFAEDEICFSLEAMFVLSNFFLQHVICFSFLAF
jgi:hypothetical protein